MFSRYSFMSFYKHLRGTKRGLLTFAWLSWLYKGVWAAQGSCKHLNWSLRLEEKLFWFFFTAHIRRSNQSRCPQIISNFLILCAFSIFPTKIIFFSSCFSGKYLNILKLRCIYFRSKITRYKCMFYEKNMLKKSRFANGNRPPRSIFPILVH